MSLLTWIILGLIAGFIASKLVGGTGQGVAMDIFLGIVGAVIGGSLFDAFGMAGAAGSSLYSLLGAVAGAAVLLMVDHTVSAGADQADLMGPDKFKQRDGRQPAAGRAARRPRRRRVPLGEGG